MGVVLPRLVFLGFVGLTGFIIYNALYLQEQRNAAALPSAVSRSPAATAVNGTLVKPPEPVRTVRTDLPPLQTPNPPAQLVTAIQRELVARGYAAGAADGKLRDQTRKAIGAFELEHGLPVTGAPTDELLRHILLGEAATPAASTGSVTSLASGNPRADPSPAPKADATVKQVQEILADLGYAPGPVDGSMGSDTVRALSAFQRDRKIAATGKISPELLREIKRVTGRDLAAIGARP
jgi:peptidoglycan hydrolase-like protein with peptidoglycan-binding domain